MDVNEPPEFDVPSASLEVGENTEANTNICDPIAAIDPESAELMYSLGGVDAGLFEIDTSTGQINVGAATTLDYESPADSDGDNIYELEVQVTDGTDEDGNADTSNDAEIGVTVTVSDVNEPPEFVVPSASLEVEENAVANTNIGDPIAAIDPESAELMYSLGGVDASLFDIDASTGQINVGAATTLDYESPEDSNGDNIYELAVQVMDGEDREGNIDTSVDDEVGVIVTVTFNPEHGYRKRGVCIGRICSRLTPSGGIVFAVAPPYHSAPVDTTLHLTFKIFKLAPVSFRPRLGSLIASSLVDPARGVDPCGNCGFRYGAGGGHSAGDGSTSCAGAELHSVPGRRDRTARQGEHPGWWIGRPAGRRDRR